MGSPGFRPYARQGIAHQYTSRLTAFEHTPHHTSTEPQNLLIFIPGLFDGLLGVTYATAIANTLPPNWTLAQPILTSSYFGWGIVTLQHDAKEISACVSYFRGIKAGKIVLMGHSTGCQDVMEYLVGPGHETRPPIDGGILQAPVSDREGMLMSVGPEYYAESCKVAQEMMDAGLARDIMPSKATRMFGPSPVSARRFLSLASPNHDGDDDYFSSDLADERLVKTFGKVPARTPLCFIFSGNDEHVPKTTDVSALLQKWTGFVKRGGGKVDEENSGIVENASHNLQGSPVEVVSELVKRVLGFLNISPKESNI